MHTVAVVDNVIDLLDIDGFAKIDVAVVVVRQRPWLVPLRPMHGQ